MKCYKGLITIFNYVNAATTSNVMVLDFQLDDLTDFPNSPQELERISYLNKIYKDALFVKGLTTVPVVDKLLPDMQNHSPTYLFDQIEYVAEIAAINGADYVLLGVVLKPTFFPLSENFT